MNIIAQLDHDSKVPLHQQAEAQLRKLIQHTDYSSGALFPKETDLAQRWGIARNTLRQAINKLVQENLLERKKRTGTRVSKQKITTSLSNWMSFSHEMEEKGLIFKNLLIKAQQRKANKEVADYLQVAPGTSIICLQRIRSTGQHPMVYFESYFHPRTGLSADENFELPLYEILDHDHNIVPVYSREEIKAIAATEKITGLLNIKKGAPVMERKRVVLDAGRKPIEYNICYYRSDWFTYSIEIKRSN